MSFWCESCSSQDHTKGYYLLQHLIKIKYPLSLWQEQTLFSWLYKPSRWTGGTDTSRWLHWDLGSQDKIQTFCNIQGNKWQFLQQPHWLDLLLSPCKTLHGDMSSEQDFSSCTLSQECWEMPTPTNGTSSNAETRDPSANELWKSVCSKAEQNLSFTDPPWIGLDRNCSLCSQVLQCTGNYCPDLSTSKREAGHASH